MISLIKSAILRCVLMPLENRGIVFTMRNKITPPDVVKEIRECRKRSFCSYIHFETVWRALDHVQRNHIDGDVVLCGVSHGGLAKFMGNQIWLTSRQRKLWLYDTFDGGSLPDENDGALELRDGAKFKRTMAAKFSDVRKYVEDGPMMPEGRIEWVVGDVMKTIPKQAPEKIALLYLDTDWYVSTRHELRWLEPRVSPGGIIIQDDMGLCTGAARAVAEHYDQHAQKPPFIVPMDEGGSVWQKR